MGGGEIMFQAVHPYVNPCVCPFGIS